jgi:hypothetical protein
LKDSSHTLRRELLFHHKMSARDHVQGINNLKLFLSLFTLYYQVAREGEVSENADLDTRTCAGYKNLNIILATFCLKPWHVARENECSSCLR